MIPPLGQIYLLLHKPEGVLTHAQTRYTTAGNTTADPRRSAVEMVREWCSEQRSSEASFPCGRAGEASEECQAGESDEKNALQNAQRLLGGLPGGMQGLHPVGRLDVDTSGALLFTTDSLLARRLLGPGSSHAQKRYLATLRGGAAGLPDAAIHALATGVLLPGRKGRVVRGMVRNVGRIRHAPRLDAVRVEKAKEDQGQADGQSDEQADAAGNSLRAREVRESAVVEVVVVEGAKRQVKHMLALVGRPLWKLHRASFCGIGVEGLAVGECRELTRAEVAQLYAAAAANAGSVEKPGGNRRHGRFIYIMPLR